jgi:hypothetical protein
LYENWIKILGLNQVRKEKEKQRRQHLEDVRNQKEGEKATTQDEEENVEWEEESLPENNLTNIGQFTTLNKFYLH